MSPRTPPIPPENRSDKGAGEPSHVKPGTQDSAPHDAPDPDKQGQQANTKVNTTHKGYQQDR